MSHIPLLAAQNRSDALKDAQSEATRPKADVANRREPLESSTSAERGAFEHRLQSARDREGGERDQSDDPTTRPGKASHEGRGKAKSKRGSSEANGSEGDETPSTAGTRAAVDDATLARFLTAPRDGAPPEPDAVPSGDSVAVTASGAQGLQASGSDARGAAHIGEGGLGPSSAASDPRFAGELQSLRDSLARPQEDAAALTAAANAANARANANANATSGRTTEDANALGGPTAPSNATPSSTSPLSPTNTLSAGAPSASSPSSTSDSGVSTSAGSGRGPVSGANRAPRSLGASRGVNGNATASANANANAQTASSSRSTDASAPSTNTNDEKSMLEELASRDVKGETSTAVRPESFGATLAGATVPQAGIEVGAASTDAAARAAEVRSERQAVDMPVSLLTVRHATHAEVDHPELGRVSIDAREHQGAIDVSLRAAHVETAAALTAIEPMLRANFDKDALSLGSYQVDLGSQSSGGGDGARSGHQSSGKTGGETSRGNSAGSAATGANGAQSTTISRSAKRVRIVL